MAKILCEKCKLIRLPHANWQPHEHICLVLHHATFDDLISSAEAGCQVCLYFRPFIEYSRSRRLGLAKRPGSDCSLSAVFGCPPGDPFESVQYGPTESLLDGFKTEYGGSEPVKFHVGPGRYYEYNDGKDRYNYLVDDDGWDSRHMQEHTALVASDDATYAAELGNRLERLGVGRSSDATHPELGKRRASREDKIRSQGEELGVQSEMYEEIQWMLATKGLCDGPELLWIQLSHYSDSCDLNTSAKDDFCTATLTAGSINTDSFEDSTKVCLNGVIYSAYMFASMHPEVWRYNPDLLPIPQKRPKQSLYPVLEFYQHRGELVTKPRVPPHIRSTFTDATFATTPPVHSREVVPDPKSFSVLELARSWLTRCTASHNLCGPAGEATLIPTRLIDVGMNGSESVRLHIAGPEDQSLPYAALSHCWGLDTGAMARLTQTNLADMTKGISMDRLPANFQDAVIITRRLHLRYLWIDAICIIQDLPEDWALESARMGKYYHGAEVTICAVAAEDCRRGILQSRSNTHAHPSIETDVGILHLRPLLEDSVTVTDAISLSDIRKAIRLQPWNQRAWTLQERLFSRRILYFTEEQMIWQCRSRFFAEDGQYSWLAKPGGTQMVRRNLVDIVDLGPRFVGKEKKKVLPSIRSTKWYELVQKYTHRRLTFPKDKLPALSGLARQIHTHTKARYVAGLWIGHLTTTLTCLMWSPVREDDDGKPPYPANNGSPSWSWTSLVAEIEHPLADDEEVIVAQDGVDPRFLSAKTTPATSDHFGVVQGGEFILECWIHEYAGVRTYHKLCKTAQVYDWAESFGNMTSHDPDSPRADPLAIFDLKQGDDMWKADDPSSEGGNQSPTVRVFYLAFIAYTNPFWDAEGPTNLAHAKQYFLLLEKTPGDGTATYRRAGVAITVDGTVLSLQEAHGWTRQKITIV